MSIFVSLCMDEYGLRGRSDVLVITSRDLCKALRSAIRVRPVNFGINDKIYIEPISFSTPYEFTAIPRW